MGSPWNPFPGLPTSAPGSLLLTLFLQGLPATLPLLSCWLQGRGPEWSLSTRTLGAWQPVVRRWPSPHCPLVTCMMELAVKVSVVAE